jgi:hypothetical protein
LIGSFFLAWIPLLGAMLSPPGSSCGSVGIVAGGESMPAIEGASEKWLPATAYAVPKETAPEGEGYFSIIEGHKLCSPTRCSASVRSC